MKVIRIKGTNNKALKIIDEGIETLQSYDTAMMQRNAQGQVKKLDDYYSATTMRHINIFLGHKLTKKQFEAMPLNEWVNI